MASSVGGQSALAPEVREQIENLQLHKDRPLLISDGDEVIFAFVRSLEEFMAPRGLYFNDASFALTGNIRRTRDDQPLGADDVKALIADFFAARASEMPLVPDAAVELKALGERCQILVLSNLPLDQRAARAAALARHGLHLPVIANTGLKGPAVREITARIAAPAIFMDDIPHNIKSVHQATDGLVHCIHFIGDERLARLLPQAEHAHARIDDWPGARRHIEELLQAAGY